jgi:hypothetical protein
MVEQENPSTLCYSKILWCSMKEIRPHFSRSPAHCLLLLHGLLVIRLGEGEQGEAAEGPDIRVPPGLFEEEERRGPSVHSRK